VARGLRVFGHPLHAMLSDLPVALLGTAIVWDAVAIARGEAVWWTIGFWNVVLGLTGAAVAAVAGFVDFVAIHGQSRAARTAQFHMYAALGAVALYVGSLVARGGPGQPADSRLVVTIALDLAGVALLGAAGWLGGHLVFHHGVGRDDGRTKDEG
jgi:uncharacterized membrane protein